MKTLWTVGLKKPLKLGPLVHIETSQYHFSSLTQQSATTESSDHFLGFPPQSLHTQGLLYPTLKGDDLNRVH